MAFYFPAQLALVEPQAADPVQTPMDQTPPVPQIIKQAEERGVDTSKGGYVSDFMDPRNFRSNIVLTPLVGGEVGYFAGYALSDFKRRWPFLVGILGVEGLSTASTVLFKKFVHPESLFGVSCHRPTQENTGIYEGCPSGHMSQAVSGTTYTIAHMLDTHGLRFETAAGSLVFAGASLGVGALRIQDEWHSPGQVLIGAGAGLVIGGGGYALTRLFAGKPGSEGGRESFLGLSLLALATATTYYILNPNEDTPIEEAGVPSDQDEFVLAPTLLQSDEKQDLVPGLAIEGSF